ncbi:MAG: methyltransferase domain-containing protein [Planctomycetes bacterium]|nr:methyltransferase domain-containing protein [Planctomycetota bacterium]
MHDRWHLATDDERERSAFASLDAVLRLPAEPAGPPNRLRHVRCLRTATGTYFLKTFVRTQWKNRIRFGLTAPRARDDGEREFAVATALRAAGFAAPRPIARGRRGSASFFLCAELVGRSCHDLAAHGAADADLRRAVAEHCGALLAAGFRLPDLSADHVFVHGPAGERSLAVLDLHNGSLGDAGPVPTKLAVRVLRRFARSARDLPITAVQAFVFAARLLRAAGRRGDTARAVLARLPAFETAARYDVAGKNVAYAERNPRRVARERKLLLRVWPGRTGESVLDLPCGAGRLRPLLQERGHRVVQGDHSFAMLRLAAAPDTPAVRADALALPFANRCVDGVVTFRFLHHLTADARARAIAEACRIARRFVVVSFFHPCSFHHLRRRFASLSRAPTRHAVGLRTIARDFAAHGFVLHTKAAELPFARDLWVASFVRRGGEATVPS